MKGYTSRTSSHSRKEIDGLIELQDKVVLPVIEKFKGKVVKTIGDAYMVVFESPTRAVLCGVEIQKAAKGKFKLRIGLNTGEVNIKNGDYFGEPVNLAARIESGAKPGGVFFSEGVYLAMNKNETRMTFMGEKEFKGIPRKVKVYRVRQSGLAGMVEDMWPKAYPKHIPAMLVIMGMLVIDWSIYRWVWPNVDIEAQQDKGIVLAAETAQPFELDLIDMDDINSLKNELLAIMTNATESAAPIPTEAPSPTPEITPEVTPTEEPTPTLTPTPTPEEDIKRKGRGRDKD